MKKIVLMLMVLTSVECFAAPQKKTSSAPEKVITSKGSDSPRSTLSKTNLQGLDLFATFDLVDSLDFDGNRSQGNANQNISGTYNAEKAFGFGGQYNLFKLDNGISIQGGGTYEMGRTISSVKGPGFQQNYSGAKPEVQLWTAFGQADVALTDRFSLFGGGNYSFPQVKNIPGGTWKGKLGYQVGGSFAVNRNMALDGMLRTINFSGSSEQDGVTTNLDNIRAQGFVLRGRYMF